MKKRAPELFKIPQLKRFIASGNLTVVLRFADLLETSEMISLGNIQRIFINTIGGRKATSSDSPSVIALLLIDLNDFSDDRKGACTSNVAKVLNVLYFLKFFLEDEF